MRLAVIALLLTWALPACTQESQPSETAVMTHETSPVDRIDKTDAQWREALTDEQYRIARQAGTERAFTGEFWDHHESGTYYAIGGTLPLFNSSTKFDSGTGWPSFYDVVNTDHVVLREDESHGMKRIEVLDAQTGHHLGHLFHDGPAPTGLRFCINSAALRFEPAAPTTQSAD